MSPTIKIDNQLFGTDEYAASVFAQREAGRVRWVDAWGQFIVWNGYAWERDRHLTPIRLFAEMRAEWIEAALELDKAGQSDKAKKAFDQIRRFAEEPRVRRALALARSKLAVDVADLDRDPWLLNTRNGMIDLRTGKARDHDRDELCTKATGTTYDPDAKAPRWERFIDEITGGDKDLAGYLQRLSGYCLTAARPEHLLPVLYGGGANGKSVYIDTLAGVMGDYATQAAPDLLVDTFGTRHPTELADLAGRRLVSASETEQGQSLKTQLVKRLTGDAKIKGRFMRADLFEFDRTWAIFLITNNKPRVKEATNAIWRRLRLVPFTVTIAPDKQDRELPEKLRAEYPGILAWMVRGCLDWQRNGLQEPEAVTNATSDYRDTEDTTVDAWEPFAESRLKFYATIPDSFKATRADLWRAYRAWARSSDVEHPLTKGDLYERVRDAGAEDCQVWGGRDGKSRVRAFRGLDIVEDHQ